MYALRSVSFHITLSDLAEYSMTRHSAQPLCDSWACCCQYGLWLKHRNSVWICPAL